MSLFELMLAMQMQEAAMYLQRGRHFSWGAYPLTGVFETSRRRAGAGRRLQDEPAEGYLRCARSPRSLRRSSLWDFSGQVAHKRALHAIFRERFASDTTEYWLKRLDEQDLLSAPVLTLAEALEHEQTRVNASVIDLDGEGVRAFGSPLSMAEGAFAVRRPPPRLGADGEAVLSEAGISAERIATLKAKGILT